jgi:hypothetical protein
MGESRRSENKWYDATLYHVLAVWALQHERRHAKLCASNRHHEAREPSAGSSSTAEGEYGFLLRNGFRPELRRGQAEGDDRVTNNFAKRLDTLAR